jgi:hypothetical protein
MREEIGSDIDSKRKGVKLRNEKDYRKIISAMSLALCAM